MIRQEQYKEAFIDVDESSVQKSNIDKKYTKYSLLPVITQPPTITGQPINNFSQRTWKEYNTQNIIIDQDKRYYYLSNTITLVKNTEFSVTVFASNPANPQNPISTEGLTFIWKRNGIVIQSLQFSNTNTIIVSAQDSIPSLSGIYTCDVTNEYGTVTTDPINIEIIDLNNSTLFNKNLIQNGSGDSNIEGWDVDGSLTIQELLDYYTTSGFSSVNRKGVFKFSFDSKVFNDDEPIYNFLPSLIDNENPDKEYASFFPSITSIQNRKYNLEDNINYYHLGLESVQYDQDQTIVASQTIDISNYYNYVDGGVYGVDQCGFELFNYLGTGILNYDMVLNDEYTNATLYPSTTDYGKPIKNIKFKQIVDTDITYNVSFVDINGSLLERRLYQGPNLTDITAVTNKQIYKNENNIKGLFNIVPNRKLDFTNLSSYLITKDNAINLNQVYYKLPTLRFPAGGSGWNVGAFTFDKNVTDPESVDNDVSDVEASPADGYQFSFAGNVAGKSISIVSSTSNENQQFGSLVDAIRGRLISMEVMLDLVTYGLDISSNFSRDTLLGLYTTIVTTIDAYTTDLEKTSEGYQDIESMSNLFLDLGVKHQNDADNNYYQIVLNIFKEYFATQIQNKESTINKIRDDFNSQYSVDIVGQLKTRLHQLIDDFNYVYLDGLTETMTPEQRDIVKGLYDQEIDLFAGDFDSLTNSIINNIITVKMDDLDILTNVARLNPFNNQDLADRTKGTIDGLRDQVATGNANVFTGNLDVIARQRNIAIESALQELWKEFINSVDYIVDDFRFRKLSNILWEKAGLRIASEVYGDPLWSGYINLFYLSDYRYNTIVQLQNAYFNKIMPSIPVANRTLNLGYLKLIANDIKPENRYKIPFKIIPESEKAELFVNIAEGRTYNAFAKGAAAFFGYNQTGSIPKGTRTINVDYSFTIKNKNISKPPPENWNSNKVTLDNYSIYSVPRAAVVGATLLVQPIKTYESNFSQSLKIPANNNWYKAKDELKFLGRSDIETAYNSSTSTTNAVNVCNNQINQYIGILPELKNYFEILPFNFFVYNGGNGMGIANKPDFYNMQEIPESVDFSKYPFIRSLINRYEYLNYLSF